MTTQQYLEKASKEARANGDWEVAEELELEATRAREQAFRDFHQRIWDRDEYDLH
jgi:hypothetical protein